MFRYGPTNDAMNSDGAPFICSAADEGSHCELLRRMWRKRLPIRHYKYHTCDESLTPSLYPCGVYPVVSLNTRPK